MNKTLILLAGVLATGAVLAQATPGDDSSREARHEQRRERAEAAFTANDSNHDGRLSQSEWQAARLRESNERFREMDLDRNGSLSKEEMQQAKPKHRGGGQGGGMREKLKGLDTDGDQQLSRAEIGDKLPRLAENFERIDANQDGKISRDEIRASRPTRDDAQR